ncbi:MAG TPA: phosphoribosylaminoimidazolesuccinocarboxamide synthase, partial [Candidatus Bathyarchaeia archaeon]|nr:phosphoribosylaminoimidazolesuccinocarboxamide synthase [Candidatus Bathyarchaeia archaeon]
MQDYGPQVLQQLKVLGPTHSGKVRDIIDLGDHLLILASDRMSAFDVIMNEPFQDKGRMLTQLSAFWFEKTLELIPNHVISMDVSDFPAECHPFAEALRGRSMLVRKCNPLPVECIVRGYLAGSGWAEYTKNGTIAGLKLPPGLIESQKLPKSEFTPSTKAELGLHDENISFARMAEIIGPKIAYQVKEISLAIYAFAQAWAEPRGILIADTKFEFGQAENGDLFLIDEVLTSDSSRFWPKEDYRPGGPQKSYDKQYLRDF